MLCCATFQPDRTAGTVAQHHFTSSLRGAPARPIMGGTVRKKSAAGSLTAAKGVLTAVFHLCDILTPRPSKSSDTLVDLGIKANCAGIMDCRILRLVCHDFFLAVVTPFFPPCINFKLGIGKGDLQSLAVTSEYLQTAGAGGDYPADVLLLQLLNFLRNFFQKSLLFAQIVGRLVTTVQHYSKMRIFLAQSVKELQGLPRSDSRQRTAWKENRGTTGRKKGRGKHGRAAEFFKNTQRQVLLESALTLFNREPAELKKHLGQRKVLRTASGAEFAEAAGIGRLEMLLFTCQILCANLTGKAIVLQKRALVDTSAAANAFPGNQLDHVAVVLLGRGYSATLLLIKIYMSCHRIPSE